MRVKPIVLSGELEESEGLTMNDEDYKLVARRITLRIEHFIWMLDFMPFEEAKKMVDLYEDALEGIEYCGQCTGYRINHAPHKPRTA